MWDRFFRQRAYIGITRSVMRWYVRKKYLTWIKTTEIPIWCAKNLNKVTSSLFPFKIIVKLEGTLSFALQSKDQTQNLLYLKFSHTRSGFPLFLFIWDISVSHTRTSPRERWKNTKSHTSIREVTVQILPGLLYQVLHHLTIVDMDWWMCCQYLSIVSLTVELPWCWISCDSLHALINNGSNNKHWHNHRPLELIAT